MKCPFCGKSNTQVKDSRDTIDETAIRRRRECPDCGGRFTTYEHVQLQDLTVIKKNGERVLFDRDKLLRSISLAVSKCGISSFEVERLVDKHSHSRFVLGMRTLNFSLSAISTELE